MKTYINRDGTGGIFSQFAHSKAQIWRGSFVCLMAKQGDLAGMYRIEAFNLIMLFSLNPECFV